ncbi:hypothetical protein IBX65_01095, partial [Candidatus Aerophobetes bacterium]|nr:hypothetical protein [Candidatus Aerophobetes bacterium]
MDRQKTPYIRAYQTLKLPNYKQEPGYLVKLDILLEDKPGSLADFSFLIAEAGGNIGFFHYDRSIDPNRVVSEVQFKERENLEKLLQLLKKSYSYSEDERLQDDIKIITPESVLEIKVRLTNRPGSLAAFACHLKEYRANVIYMLYNEDIDPE